MFVGNSLIDMYTKCGDLEDANMQCGLLECHIFGYMRCEQGQKAVELFQQLQHGGYIVQAHPVTFVRVLNTCAIVQLHLKNGRHIHEKTSQKLL